MQRAMGVAVAKAREWMDGDSLPPQHTRPAPQSSPKVSGTITLSFGTRVSTGDGRRTQWVLETETVTQTAGVVPSQTEGLQCDTHTQPRGPVQQRAPGQRLTNAETHGLHRMVGWAPVGVGQRMGHEGQRRARLLRSPRTLKSPISGTHTQERRPSNNTPATTCNQYKLLHHTVQW